jgi:hypothetical protein
MDKVTENQDTFNVASCTTERFVTELQNNAALRSAYLADPNSEQYRRFNDELDGKKSDTSNISGEAVAANATTTAQGQQQSDPDLLTVTLKVKKYQLGSFLTNRTPEEAVLAKLKGKDDADRYIESLKSNISHYTNETTTLRRQLKDATDKATQITAPVVSSTPATPLPNMDDLKGVDLFDVDGQKKLLDSVAAIATAVTNQQGNRDVAKETQTAPQTQDDVLSRQKSFEQNELAQMRELQYRVPELATSRDILEIDREVAKTYVAMDNLAGGQGGIDLYLSPTPQGQAFRERCQSSGVALPAEYDQWYQIMSTREKRMGALSEMASSLSEKRGEKFSIYDVYDTPRSSYVDFFAPIESPLSRISKTLSDHQAARAAAELPSGTVPEIPQSILNTQLPADVKLWSDAQADSFINSKPLNAFTRDEAIIVKQIYEAMQVPVPSLIADKIK